MSTSNQERRAVFHIHENMKIRKRTLELEYFSLQIY